MKIKFRKLKNNFNYHSLTAKLIPKNTKIVIKIINFYHQKINPKKFNIQIMIITNNLKDFLSEEIKIRN
jgi:hypothetical protein